MEASWGELEDRTLNDPRFFLFEGSRHGFDDQVVDQLQETSSSSASALEWLLGD